MCRSSTTASGASSSTSSIADRPFVAVATTDQLTLRFDQLAQRHEEILVVVSEQDADPALRGHSVQGHASSGREA